MKILLVNKFLYPRGGDAVSLLATGKLLAEKGHEVFYWGMDHPDNPAYPTQEYFVPAVDYEKSSGVFEQVRAAAGILYSFEAKRRLAALLKKIRPDIVHLQNFSHQLSPSILDAIKHHNIPAVMVMCDYKLVCPSYTMLSDGRPCERCAGRRFYHCFLRRCTKHSRVKSLVNTVEMYLHHTLWDIYRHIDVFVAPSVFLEKKVRSMGFAKEVVYLPHYIDSVNYAPQRAGARDRICYFGRLSAEKGLLTLLDAVKGSDARLRIVGDGPLKAALAEKINNENIGNAELAGYKTGDALRSEIQDACCVVVPSEWYENNPLSVLEAFALGKPVVGARIGGIPELVIDGQTGWTFTPGSAADLREKLNSCMNRPQDIEAFGSNARVFVEQNFNPAGYYEKLMEMYAGALRKKRMQS